MRIWRVVLLLIHAFVVSRPAGGAAVGRFEGERQQQHTAVINLRDSRRVEEESRGEEAVTTVAYGQEDEEEYDDEEEYYYGDEYDDGMSGDYEVEMPRVAMSSKPKDPSAVLESEKTPERRRGKGRKRGKGKGKKRNPCLRKYKDFCIHGTCQYLRDIRATSCVCHPSYSGDRCQFFTLPVEGKTQEGYSRTTALAVVAVVLSSVCLTIIGLLLALRFHKRGAYDVENEEKVKLGLASNH